MRVAIADTGIDYLHRDFGGPGIGYAANDRTRIGDVTGYPGPRVVGGHDFAGDDYNASLPGDKSVPQPDPDPMDCYGHGTHVAGTAAGSGVTAARTTYTVPYDTSIDFSKLHIGPGVAPQATIYALKIFGCDGSTNLTDLALEWAVDPNQDGDFGDHLDVINLSLGSPYGWEYDTSVAAANNAALAGVIVVASAGNSGDFQLITSAPASADRAISVAATQHVGNTVASFSSRGPRRGDAGLKPDVAAPGTGIVSAKTGTGSERRQQLWHVDGRATCNGVDGTSAPGASRLERRGTKSADYEQRHADRRTWGRVVVPGTAARADGRRTDCAPSGDRRRHGLLCCGRQRAREPIVRRTRSGRDLYGDPRGSDRQQVGRAGTIRTDL